MVWYEDLKVIWYEDKEIIIEFDGVPKTTLLFPIPSMDKSEKKAINEKPFLNKKNLFVTITDKRKKTKEYRFLIEKGYRWDGATINRLFWRIIGAKTAPEFQIASMIHDKLCTNKDFINYDRLLSSKVFRGLLIAGGVGKFKADLMFHCVDNFQKFCGWKRTTAESYKVNI